MPTSSPRPNPPAARSAGNALRLAVILQNEGAITVTQAAERLGVSVAAAHRLLQALVQRDFAVQAGDRRYHSGPVLGGEAAEQAFAASLRAVAMPLLSAASEAAARSMHLTIRSGYYVRMLASIALSRDEGLEGAIFPLQSTATGLLILSAMDERELDDVFPHLPDPVPPREDLERELAEVRRQGYAVQIGRAEAALTGIAVPLRWNGQILAGVAASLRSTAYVRSDDALLVEQLRHCAAGVESAMGAGFQPDPSAL